MAKKNNSEQFTSILYIIIGLLLVIFKGETLNWAMTIAGAFFIISGALDIIKKKNYTGGGISLVIGIAIIVLGWLMAKIVLLVLGILIAVKGIVALVEIFKSSKPNALDIVFPALTVVVGLALAFGNALNPIIVITGILLAIDGALGLVGSLKK